MDRKVFLGNSLKLGMGLVLSPVLSDTKNESGSKPESSPKKRTPANPRVVKKIIVAGAGIAGLTCAYELMQKGHEVIVLEAAGRYGGKVYTSYGDLPDELYAEFGAEGFTIPGYIKYREYLTEFELPYLPYHHNKNRYTLVNNEWLSQEEQSQRRLDAARNIGSFNRRERKFLADNPADRLERLYLEPYLEKFSNEYQPLGIGYDHLDSVPISEIYTKEGASPAALSLLGGSSVSALQKLWESYIMEIRGYWDGHERQRIKGGNQRLVNEFAKRLGTRIQLGCRILNVDQGKSGVTVTYQEFGETKKMEADYLACCLNVQAINNILFNPVLPPEKQYVLENLVFQQTARVIFQARSKFWEENKYGINLTFNHASLRDVAQVAHEVDSDRVAIKTKSAAGTTPAEALNTFKRLYPGDRSKIDIENVLIQDWSRDAYTPGCQRLNFPMGELSRYWPHLQAPAGNIHFAGGYADNRVWGMEAAVNSANIVANQIDLD